MRKFWELYFVFRNPDDPDWSEKKKEKGHDVVRLD
jgi:hypothetical protein